MFILSSKVTFAANKKTKGVCKHTPFLITYALPQLRGSQKVTFTRQI